MGNIFKKSKVSRITTQDRAVLQLKQQRDKLRQYQRRVETSLEKDRVLAKTLLAAGKKPQALLLLRKKRYQEGLLENTDRQLHNIEQLAADIEFASVEVQVVDGLKAGNKALQDINATMDLDEIAQIMEETQEAAAKQEEINAMLSGVLTSEDEDAVLQELDKLIQEEVDELPVVAASGDVEAEEEEEEILTLPIVPDDKIKVKEERNTRQLEAAS